MGVYITGDTHGDFYKIEQFCNNHSLTLEDTIVILGDVGLNYYGDGSDDKRKRKVSKLPPTLFCIHGNHEMRPSAVKGYERKEYRGGSVWYQPQYPNIVFAIDGEVYDFGVQKCLVIGGAYSVDKYYRLANGWRWFPDEQPDEETKRKVEAKIASMNGKTDIVMSHTCPMKYLPTEVFLSGIDQSTVDNSTEEWLDSIEEQLDYKRWLCGHYHTDKTIDKIRFMFDDFIEL